MLISVGRGRLLRQVGHILHRPNRQPDPLVQYHELKRNRHVPDRPGGYDHDPCLAEGHPAL